MKKEKTSRDINWFRSLFHFDELKCRDDDEVRKHFNIEGRYIESENRPDIRYQIGKFRCLSVKDLMKQIKSSGRRRPKIKVQNLIDDVFSLHTDKKNNHDAVFMIASQFNCLESPYPDEIVKLTNYTKDKTQRPTAAVAAGPGSVFRHYFMKKPVNNVNKLMELYPDYFECVNGYIDSTDDKLRALNSVLLVDRSLRKKVIKKLVNVGVHWDVEVPFHESTRYSNQYFRKKNTDRL